VVGLEHGWVPWWLALFMFVFVFLMGVEVLYYTVEQSTLAVGLEHVPHETLPLSTGGLPATRPSPSFIPLWLYFAIDLAM